MLRCSKTQSKAIALLIIGLVVGGAAGFIAGYFARSQSKPQFGNSQLLVDLNSMISKALSAGVSKPKLIKLFEDGTITAFLGILPPGAEIKAHYHEAHDETVYVIQGSGEMLINGTWVKIKAGEIHYNPAGKVHATKNTGNEPLIVIAIFTPGMKKPDRHFVS